MGIIRRIKAKQKKNNNKYSVTVTVGDDSEQNVKTVKVAIEPVSGQPSPSPKNLSLSFSMNSGEDRIFSNDSLTFSSNAAGYTYEMTATMLDVNGNQIGDQLTESVLIEEYSAEGEGEGEGA